MADYIADSDDPKIVQSLLLCFNCKFKASDFEFLSKKIQIFPLLFRGRILNKPTFISNTISFYNKNIEQRTLAECLTSTF